MLALLDLDILVYYCGFACQKTVWDVLVCDDFGNIVGCSTFATKAQAGEGATPRVVAEPVEHALHAFKESIDKILRNTGAGSYKGFLTGDGNFREKIATIRPYKGNRDKLHKPVHYQALRDYAVKYWNTEIVNGEEADDRITQYHMDDYWDSKWLDNFPTCENQYGTIVCSVDKDFDQVPGWHYNPKKELRYWVSEEEALRNFWISVLSGDPVDNIVGVPGIGPKKAAKLLEECVTDYDYYRKASEEFRKHYSKQDRFGKNECGFEELVETARLLFLRRVPGEEWNPPTEGAS